MSSAVEFDVGSGQGRVIAAPPGRDLRRAIRWLAVRRFLIAGLALFVGLAAAWYGYRWWTVGRLSKARMTLMSAARSRSSHPGSRA
jgi:hypothetical protein